MSNVLVIGGGFFGMYLAEHLARSGHAVQLVEKAPTFMSRASYANQARVHNGYHYPRSILTALRSRLSFPRFVDEFRDCVDSEFSMYYLIGKPLGNVSAHQFLKFCERIGAPCEPAPSRIQAMTNPTLIEASFATTEYAFDAIKLRDLMVGRLDAAGVAWRLDTSAESVRQFDSGLIVKISDTGTGQDEDVYADHVFNCTYSRINQLLANSSLELIPIRHELTELCLAVVPEELKRIGITVMCGPFFSAMPFPSTSLHSFSHVRYTPHCGWIDEPGRGVNNTQVTQAPPLASAWRHMQTDAQRFIPALSECEYQRSLWEVKSVLPRSEADDSRPILFRPHHGLRGFHCVMGGKIDNVYDVVEAVRRQGLVV